MSSSTKRSGDLGYIKKENKRKKGGKEVEVIDLINEETKDNDKPPSANNKEVIIRTFNANALNKKKRIIEGIRMGDNGRRCHDHHRACGLSLSEGKLVVFQKEYFGYRPAVAAFLVTSSGKLGCKVGFIRSKYVKSDEIATTYEGKKAIITRILNEDSGDAEVQSLIETNYGMATFKYVL